MAFRRLVYDNRKIQMASLIDLIFILLIFFIISSILIKLTTAEARLYIPTPKNEPGEAQVLVQILDNGRYLWIDHTAIDTLQAYSYRMTDPLSPKHKVNLLLKKMALNAEQLDQKIEHLQRRPASGLNKDYFILIRCPDEQPYYHATNVIEKLVDVPNLEYGCVSGSIEDIQSSKNILAEGNVIQIDF